MPIADDFIKCCTSVLEANFGLQSSMIINGVKSKKDLNNTPNISDFEDFIFLTGLYISLIAGKNKANDVCDALTAWVKKIAGEQKQDVSIIDEIDKEISDFLIKNELSAEEDITEFTKYLAIKYSGNAKKIENGLLRKVRNHVKNAVSKKRIREEIDRFLTKYKQPTENDINDFIDYIQFLRLNFRENELRQQIEKVRLFRKFHRPGDEEFSESYNIMDFLKTPDDLRDINRALKLQELSYLINHEPGISDGLSSLDFGHEVLDHPIAVCDEKLKILAENAMIQGKKKEEQKDIVNEPQPINKSDKSTDSKIQDALDYFFEVKGIPGESDINDIKDLILCGCGEDTKKLIDKIKQVSKEKIILALNDSIMTGEIRSFIIKNPCYSQVDVENFINYLKVRKFKVNNDEVADLIEKECLFSRFNEMDRKENLEEKISKQYTALFNSENKNEYKYILEHDDDLIQLKLQLKLAKVLKEPQGNKKHCQKKTCRKVIQNLPTLE